MVVPTHVPSSGTTLPKTFSKLGSGPAKRPTIDKTTMPAAEIQNTLMARWCR
jgi:hypothetical protein